jgi:hypothetical protein
MVANPGIANDLRISSPLRFIERCDRLTVHDIAPHITTGKP